VLRPPVAVQPLTIKNATVWNGTRFEQRDLYTSDVILDKPARNAITVDLAGYTILPGLINAHDHLELNHYPRTKFRERYTNAHQWGEDVNARLNDEPFRSLRAYPLKDRLFIGGLKNLLCGVTTVAHHNPPHKALFRRDFPVRVLRRYGWAHSLHFSSEAEIIASYRKTPPDVPWFIHLAEGTDEIAAGEYKRLKALGCVGSNTVIVHGVGMTDEDIADAVPSVRGLVWCPSTNRYLLGKTANIKKWLDCGGKVALGSDSRLTAVGDLQDEVIDGQHSFAIEQVLRFVTDEAAFLLGVGKAGTLQPHAPTDLFVYRGNLRRSETALVVRGGVPQLGDPDVMARFPHVETVPATLDGAPKAINLHLVRQIARCSLQEPGLRLEMPIK
jgi:cytosine/adenosine deaminase-related metal-dependent hydrolase